MTYKERVLKHFKGIDEFITTKRAEFNAIDNNERYQSGYINEMKYKIEQEIINDRKERGEKALDEIETIMNELKEKKFKNPYHEVGSQVITTQDKLLVEMQQARKADILKLKLKSATTHNEYMSLIDEYGDYEYFYDIITLELKSKSKDNPAIKRTLLELDKEPEEFRELKQLESTVKMIANSEHHPKGIGAEGYENIKFEPLLKPYKIELN